MGKMLSTRFPRKCIYRRNTASVSVSELCCKRVHVSIKFTLPVLQRSKIAPLISHNPDSVSNRAGKYISSILPVTKGAYEGIKG